MAVDTSDFPKARAMTARLNAAIEPSCKERTSLLVAGRTLRTLARWWLLGGIGGIGWFGRNVRPTLRGRRHPLSLLTPLQL
jgi:hypothetical protein